MAVGVCAAATGKKLFENIGFTKVQEVVVAGYREHPDSITAWIGVRQPVGGRGIGQDENVRPSEKDGQGEASGQGGGDGLWEDCGRGGVHGSGGRSGRGGESGQVAGFGQGKI